jgi:uncharacterized membrane protein
MIVWHTFSLLLHIAALVLWLGSMAFFLVVFGPAVHGLSAGDGVKILNRGRTVFETISWAAIAVLLVTGIVNLILQRELTGTHLGQYYLAVLALKLMLFGAMLVHHLLQVFKYGPKILALTPEAIAETSAWPEPLRAHWQRWFILLKINAALGAVVSLLGLALVKS